MVLRELSRLGPSIPVGAVKACAWIGLHMMFKEKSGRSENGSSVSSSALFVMGLHRSSDTIALFLQDWEVASLCQEEHEVERRRGWFGF